VHDKHILCHFIGSELLLNSDCKEYNCLNFYLIQ